MKMFDEQVSLPAMVACSTLEKSIAVKSQKLLACEMVKDSHGKHTKRRELVLYMDRHLLPEAQS